MLGDMDTVSFEKLVDAEIGTITFTLGPRKMETLMQYARRECHRYG